MKEEWRTVLINGKEHLWYSVSNFGNIRSHLQVKGLPGGGSLTYYNLSRHRDRKAFKVKNRDGSISCMKVKLQFPDDFFEDYQYARNKNSTTSVERKCPVHKLVMEAFRPMDEYPPDRIKDCWNDIPEDAKTWIKESVFINHIDHDPSNNHVDNLEYVTPIENSRAAVKYYGGNMANKGKQKPDDEFIVITEPKFNPLLQEWEDGKIEFLGEEGEECYNMLEAIAKERGCTPDEAFWEAIRRGLEDERTVS